MESGQLDELLRAPRQKLRKDQDSIQTVSQWCMLYGKVRRGPPVIAPCVRGW